jgi:hypothetical protein
MSDQFGFVLFALFWILVPVFYIYVGWRIHEKADQPGWAALVPVYNTVILLRIVGRPMWWLLLLVVIPVGWLIIPFDLAKSFGKGTGFGLGLMLLSPVFAPILAFGDATYEGPAAADAA